MSGVSESGLKNLEKGRKAYTKENAAEMGRKGGLASQAAHRKKKQTAELVKAILDSKITDKNAEGIRSIAPDIADDEATVRALIIAGQARSAAAGYGLNLQEGGHIVIWYGLTWSLEQYQQANARLYRQGQEKPVIVHHLVAEGTVDEQVMAALKRKDMSQAALLEALKERSRQESWPG